MTARTDLSVTQGAALSVGAVLGTGLISLPALAADAAGPASLVAWLALIVLSAPLAWTFAALGARYPDAGGVSTYAGMAFGPRVAAAVGWTFYLAVPLGAPVAVGFTGGYVSDVLGGGRATELATFLVIVGVAYVMNWFGLRISGRVQVAMSIALATMLVVTVVAAWPHARWENLTPFAPHGWTGVGAAAALLVWGFAGWEALSSLSGEYRNPRRDVPRATLIAVGVVGVLYLAVAAVSVLALGPALAGSRAPLADLLAIGLGGPVRLITAVIAVVLTLGAVNAYFAGSSRLGAALAREGSLPAALRTPRRSLTFVLVAAIGCVLLPLDLHTTALLTTGCFTLVYVIGTAAALRLLPGAGARVVAGSAFAAVVVLLWLNGWPALFSVVVAAAAVAYQAIAGPSPRKLATPSAQEFAGPSAQEISAARTASPSSIRSSSTAPNPTTSPSTADSSPR